MLTNAEALELLNDVTGKPLYMGMHEASTLVAEHTGIRRLWLYWLPRNTHQIDMDAYAEYDDGREAMDRKALVAHSRKLNDT